MILDTVCYGLTVLVVHHDADLYGADRSLMALLRALKHGGAQTILVVPYEGPLVDWARHEGLEVHIGPVGKVSRAIKSPMGWSRFAMDMVRSARFFNRIIAGRRISLVYSNSIVVLGGSLWGFLHRIPRLTHVREIVVSPRFIARTFPRILDWLGTWCVCNSHATQDWIVRECPALAARSTVIWNGLEAKPEGKQVDAAAVRTGMGVPSGDVLVTLVGRINRWKGHHVFVEAAEILRDQGLAGFRMLFVGDAPRGQEQYRHAILAKVRERGLEDVVRWHPFVPEVDIVWAASDIAVVPSIEPEPFGRVAIEAMGHGLPVIAAGHGGLTEIVQDEVTGLLVKPGDAPALAAAIRRLIESPSLREAYGTAGRARQLEHFTQKQHDRRLLSLVRRISLSHESANVLLVHQGAEMYGSDRVLLNIVVGIRDRGFFHPIVVVPQRGPLFDALVAADIEVHLGDVAKISRAAFSGSGMLRLARSAWRSIGDIDRIAAGRRISLVHSNTLAVFAGAIWARWRRVPHLWHVHEIVLSPRVVSKAFPLMLRVLSGKVMSNSKQTERWILTEQPELASRSVVVFNGLPPASPPPVEAIRAFRSAISAADGDVVVTLAGRLNHWKGQGLLIEAATLMQSRGTLNGVKFAIVGDTVPGQESILERLIAQVDASGIAGRVSFVSFVDDIRPVWCGSQIAVVPSTEPEPFGMVAIEAMAAGVPVVAAAHGGLLDIVVDGETGLLFTPRDAGALAVALERLVRDANLRRSLGEQGARRQAEHFSLESQIEQTEAAYRSMIVAR